MTTHDRDETTPPQAPPTPPPDDATAAPPRATCDRDQLGTNRDLYLFLSELTARRSQRSLEDYLKALWQLALRHRHREALPLPCFAELLELAFSTAPPPFEPAWAAAYQHDATDDSAFARWEKLLLRQIVDLHELAECGGLADEHRYFGLDAPRGARWYNFDPGGFLECAAAGSFAGWREGDPTDRQLVPGLVAVLDEHGQLTTADPRELEEPIVALPTISWDDFSSFLQAGQLYE